MLFPISVSLHRLHDDQLPISSPTVDKEVLEVIPHIDAGYRTSGHVSEDFVVEGTFSSLLIELNDWADGRNEDLKSKPIYLLTGEAGSGKSTIASEFARRLDGDHRLGASFFFTEKTEESSMRLFASSVAYQLAQSQPALRPHIAAVARQSDGANEDQHFAHDGAVLLERSLRAVTSQFHAPVILVIDSIGDASSASASQVLQCLIATVRQSQVPIRVFLTSRSGDVVEKIILSEYPSDVHRVSMQDVPREAVDQDITSLLRAKQIGRAHV